MRSISGIVLVLAAFAQCGPASVGSRPREFPAEQYARPLEKEMIEAAFQGKVEKVKDCLARGARIDTRYGGDSKYFVSQDGGWPMSGHNWSALMAATENDRFETAEFLVAQGASVKIDDGWGATPLYALASKRNPRKKYDTLAALFIERGADVNAKTDVYVDGPADTTVLHRAVGWGHVAIVEMLIAAGADVNARTSSGETPLDFLFEGRNDTAVREILKNAGAKSGSATQGGRLRSVSLARSQKPPRSATFLSATADAIMARTLSNSPEGPARR